MIHTSSGDERSTFSNLRELEERVAYAYGLFVIAQHKYELSHGIAEGKELAEAMLNLEASLFKREVHKAKS